MNKAKDFTGKRFGKLVAIENTNQKDKSRQYIWKCRCDCGNIISTSNRNLTSGASKSCGKCPTNTFYKFCNFVMGLTAKGEPFYFDIEDFELVTKYNWHITDKGRVQTNTPDGPVRMHRLLTGFPPNDVDHRNGEQNNNRRYNLRVCSHANNMRNMKKHIDGSSKYKGVSWASHCRKWRAQIFIDGKRIHLGYFGSEELAHKEYCKASLKYHGEFGRTA